MSETSFIFALLAMIYAASMFLLPFFIMRIRREVIAINQKMSRLEELLAQLSARQLPAVASRPARDERGRLVKVCENCGRKNSLQDVQCIGCGELFQ
jgi:hypothetical protein